MLMRESLPKVCFIYSTQTLLLMGKGRTRIENTVTLSALEEHSSGHERRLAHLILYHWIQREKYW